MNKLDNIRSQINDLVIKFKLMPNSELPELIDRLALEYFEELTEMRRAGLIEDNTSLKIERR